MSKPRPLTPAQASRSLLARFAPKVDRLRQLGVRFGARPYRVFLVWTKWSGLQRGEGVESEHRRCEILPSPKVQNLDSLTATIAATGTTPTGTIRLTEVSACFSFDQLSGHLFPYQPTKTPDPYDFFYEVVEDGRHDPRESRRKFRVSSPPSLDAENVQWVVMLERESEDRDRDGTGQAGPNRD